MATMASSFWVMQIKCIHVYLSVVQLEFPCLSNDHYLLMVDAHMDLGEGFAMVDSSFQDCGYSWFNRTTYPLLKTNQQKVVVQYSFKNVFI